MHRIILGSSSPRRKEILGAFTLPFEVASPPFNEDAIPFNGNPIDYVNTLSSGKANSLHPIYPNSIILTADTIVYHQQKVYNKPCDFEEAVRFLRDLVGQQHSVFTGVTLRFENIEHHQVEETKVFFNSLSDEEIRHYLTHMSWKDKSGGYAIQAAGGLLVRKIDGCYYNVMGLPINSVRELLLKAGIDLWHYIK